VKILMATGGSPHSEAALQFGAMIAQYAGEPPVILTVIRRESHRSRAEEILAQAQKVVAPTIPTVRTKVRVGHPAQEIVSEATVGHYDLVIVGERLVHALRTRVLGSTAVYVVEHAPCPVIIAKGRIQALRRILLCDSGALSPSLLSRFTAQLAGMLEGDEEITVLHVMSQITAWPGVRGKQLRADADELIQEHAPEGVVLQQDIQVLTQPGVHATPKVRHGLVVEEILAESCEGSYDLIVIGAHRDEGWQRFLLEDIAHEIITQVDRPVLVVR
jgi:nucleotide-binding universal stress UspA family protein